MLPDDKRAQLDTIVQKMVAAKESDSNIQFVVDDFKKKYSVQPVAAPAQSQSQPKTGLLNTLEKGATAVTDTLGLHGAVDSLSSAAAAAANPKLYGEGLLPVPGLRQGIGTGLQLGSIVGGGALAAPEGIAANAAVGGGLGAAQAGGKALAENKPLAQVGVDAATGAAVGGAVSGMTALAGKFLERVGDKIQYSVIKPTQADIKDGFNINTIKKYNLGGSLPQVFKKTESQMDELTSQLNQKLAASDAHINLNEILKQTEAKLSGNKTANFGSTGSISNAIAWLQGEIDNVGTDVNLTDANIIKRATGHFGAWQYGMRDPESTARERVANAFYTELKTAIEQKSPVGVREINKQLSEMIPVLNAVIRRIPVAERNNAISLTDVIGLVGSSINPNALGFTLLNALSKSGTVANILSKTGAKIPSAAPAAATLGTAAATQLASERTK